MPTDGPRIREAQLEAADALQVEPDAALAADDPQEHGVAARAARDRPGGLGVDGERADLPYGSARAARRAGDGQVSDEDLAEEAADGVAVELQVGALHAHDPLGPNRSVLTRLGS